ncbi:MAG: hypothetical protein IJN54_01925 [Lachnospiraceae bacterium]|nr:hypothetical protein [Lachnospiraceae bacterium]
MRTKYKNFFRETDADNWVNTYKKYFPSNEDEDKDFLSAIHYYTGSANTLINNALRYDKNILDNDFMQPIFQRLIEKVPTYQIPDNIVVYRYISKGLLKEMCPSYPPRKSMIICDKGFMSTTLIRTSINDYRRSNPHQNILLEISVPAGTKGIYVGHLENTLSEYEAILAPNTKLRIEYSSLFSKYFRCTVVS